MSVPDRLTGGQHTLAAATPVEDLLAAAVIVKPGDTLIIGFTGRLEAERVDQMVAALKERLPDIKFCLIDQVAAFAAVAKE